MSARANMTPSGGDALATTAFDSQVAAAVQHLGDVSDRVASRFMAEFERLKAEGSPDAFDNRLGFADGNGKVVMNVAAIKYVLNARAHIAQKVALLPYFEGIKSAYDIGVGPAQMWVLLADVFGVDMRGLDKTNSQGEFLYRALWEEYGISDHVEACEVRAGVDVPIPFGTEAVLALWPVFDSGWLEHEHAWFIDMCRAHGAKRVFWKFNSHTIYDYVIPFYLGRGARFPARDRGFCILDL